MIPWISAHEGLTATLLEHQNVSNLHNYFRPQKTVTFDVMKFVNKPFTVYFTIYPNNKHTHSYSGIPVGASWNLVKQEKALDMGSATGAE